MRVVENLSAAILESLEKNDIESYIDYRDKLIIRVVDQDYFSIENIENHFIVGKALALILDDMYNKQPLLYKRIVLSAVYCLLKVIIRDRYNKGQSYECCSVIFSKVNYAPGSLYQDMETALGRPCRCGAENSVRVGRTRRFDGVERYSASGLKR